MKNLLPLLLVLFAALVATTGFSDVNRKGGIQPVLQHSAGLAGVQYHVAKGRHVGFACSGDDATVYTACRYVLAPMYIPYRKTLPTDTLLVVNERDKGDSLVRQLVSGHRVLWQNAHLGYDYYLICNE